MCDLLLFFIFIFIIVNHILSLKQTHFLEYALLFLNDNEDEESEWSSNSKSSASGCCLAFS